MVARVRFNERFVVSFLRDGLEVTFLLANTGEEARNKALVILSEVTELRDGDILKCVEESL